MDDIVGVRFQEAGKIYYFSASGYDDLTVAEYVIVDTGRGRELARVVIAPGQVLNAELTEPLKPILGLASAEDLELTARLKLRADLDVDTAQKKARHAGLPMKVVSGSYNLDGNRLTLLFTSESRADFRELAHDVSRTIGAQVQLRQIGPRDQAKILGGYGICGRRLCCTSWLLSFPAISIKMAKEQDVSLNPSKISGQCGRLLCCLSYENDMYRQLKQQLPRPGVYISTPTGNARVLAVNVPREIVTLQMESSEIIDVPVQALGMDQGLVRILDERPAPRPMPEPARRPTRPSQVPPNRPPAAETTSGLQPGPVEATPGRDRGPRPRPQPHQAAPLPSAAVPPARPEGANPAGAPAGTTSNRRRRRRGRNGRSPRPPAQPG